MALFGSFSYLFTQHNKWWRIGILPFVMAIFLGSSTAVSYTHLDVYKRQANGGVSDASANNDASSTFAYVGSRLAFRGKIVRAQSVAAYKAIREVA